MKASFSHFSLSGNVNSQFQEFRVSFPFLLYEIQYKLGLTFTALQFFSLPFLISFIPDVSKILCWAVSMGAVVDSLGR